MKHQLFVPVLGMLALTVAVPAHAQWVEQSGRGRYDASAEVRRAAYDRGFREGLTEGEKDGRSRDPFRYDDERDFQRGTVGYDRRYGNVERYQFIFREGFVDGYTQGYERYAPRSRNDRYGSGRYGGGRYGTGPYGGYGDRRPGYGVPPGRDDRYLRPYDIGLRDGFEKGREDANDRDSYDPRRHKWYRDGDREFNSRYGSREQYKDEYRRGFVAGYEQGYRRY